MKSILKFSNLSFLALIVLIGLTSCGGDDEIIIDPGPIGIAVADGFYMASTAADPVATDVLTGELVEDGGYASQSRAGFIANYIYVSGGSYNIVEIKDKEIVATWGGTASTVTDEGSACDKNDFTLAILAADGAAVDVTAGLYKVSFDTDTKELILYKIEEAGVIGSATPNSWDDDTLLDGTIAADEATWTKTDVKLVAGEVKVRFNCRWTINRRIDDADGFVFENGYQMFTNFGGTLTELETGGANIQIDGADTGIYTVTITWTPADGYKLALEKTGDVVNDFVAADHQWAVTGAATPNGWPQDDPAMTIVEDHDLAYLGLTGTTHSWEIETIDLGADEFKFRQNDNWADQSIGWMNMDITGDIDDIDGGDAGSNFQLTAAGSYKITMMTSDNGLTYSANFVKL